jgi:hypothetical protein
MKCGDAAKASIGAISSKADVTIALGMPIFLIPSDIFTQLVLLLSSKYTVLKNCPTSVPRI